MKSELLYDRLERMRGISLTDEDKYEIDQWGRGRALAQILPTEGYQEVLAVLESYAGNATEELLKIVPGDDKNILAQHAVAFAASKIFTNFIQDVQRAVDASITTPECVKQGLKAGPAPVESSL